MTPADLRRLILHLDPSGPVHLELEAALRPAGAPQPWYRSQREHWLGWLADYAGPGAYGRADGRRSAGFVFNHLQCAPALAWLAEAAGVPAEMLTEACAAVLASGSNRVRQCAAFRQVVPWSTVQQRLLTRPQVRPAVPRTRRPRSARLRVAAGVNDNQAAG